MKKLLAVLILIALSLLIFSGCELTVTRTKTEYDAKTNTIRRTTTILPDLDKQLESILGK